MTCGVVGCWAIFLQLLAIGLSNGAIIALNAIGFTLVYGAIRLINFAHGDLFALTTVVVTFTVSRVGLGRGSSGVLIVGSLLLALAAAVSFGAALNVAVERVAFRPFRGGSRLAPLIASVGVSFLLYQAALLWRKTQSDWIPGEHRSVPGIPEVPLQSIADVIPNINLVRALGLPLQINYTLKDLTVLLIAAGVSLIVGWFLNRTNAGRALRACAQDPEMAQLCGVNRNAAIRLAFALGGVLAGAAGFVFALYYNRPFTQYGAQSGLIALTAAVLGGIGRPRGAFFSGLLLGVLAALSDFFLAAQWTPVLVLTILILLLMLRPTGLAGDERGEDQTAESLAEGMLGGLRANGGSRQRWLAFGLVLVGVSYPLLDRMLGLHVQSVVTNMLIFALLALGLNIVLGFAGLLDLGYTASFAIGAYTAALLTTAFGSRLSSINATTDFLIVLLCSGVLAGVFAGVIGALTLRLRGDYLAIVTLAFGQIVPQLILNLDRWTGGSRGLSPIPPPRILTYNLRTADQRYYLALLLLGLAAFASYRLVHSRLGRAWAATGADELAAISAGINAGRTRTLAFALGATVAGMAGALFASVFGYLDPGQFSFTVAAMVLAMVVIGGAGNVVGVIIGALVVAGYDQFVIRLLGASLEQLAKANGSSLLAALDLRALSYGSFGLALYLTVLLRARTRSGSLAGRRHPFIRLAAALVLPRHSPR